jgi:hypothetical protein
MLKETAERFINNSPSLPEHKKLAQNAQVVFSFYSVGQAL